MAAPVQREAAIPLENWGHTALALRGYDQTNLGRTAELLAVPAYAPICETWLRRASDICSQATGRRVDLLSRVRNASEPRLDAYAEAVALVMATELAQLELLEQCHGWPVARARLAFGYSLGEVIATAASQLLHVDDAMRVPLELATDCAALADNCTLAIVFSRVQALPLAEIELACIEISSAGGGTIGVSSILSPNTLLVVGQGATVARLEAALNQPGRPPINVRPNPDRWPPMHTPIVRERHVPDRAAVMMAGMSTRQAAPTPPVFSLTSGRADLGPLTIRETLRNWTDHPQRLWDAVHYTLAAGIDTVVHVGPAPNVIPATFQRLANNVIKQTSGHTLQGYGMWAMSGLARQPWLAGMLPRDSALLRAPEVRQVILEDWLLAHAPA